MKVVSAALVAAALSAYVASPAAQNPAAAESQSVALSQSQGNGNTERYLCDQRTSVVGELTQSFREKPVAVGMQGNGTLLELFASKETGSWTVLITLPSGVSCLTLVGDSFEMLPQKVAGPGA